MTDTDKKLTGIAVERLKNMPLVLQNVFMSGYDLGKAATEAKKEKE